MLFLEVRQARDPAQDRDHRRLRAVEHLRGVFAEMHATTIRDVVSFHDIWGLFDEDGTRPKASDARGTAVKTFIAQLTWWGAALREARRAHPYAA